MKAVKFLHPNSFEVDFEGYTYSFPKSRAVMADDELAAFVKETWPMSFEEVKPAKDEVLQKVDRVKTPVRFVDRRPTTDMVVKPLARPTSTFNVDSDSLLDYGEGVVQETI
jgi:hypothetical protein